MRDDENRTVPIFLLHALKDLNQILETPEIDARFRFVENGKLCPSRQHCGDFDPLQLAAGQTAVDFSADIFIGAQSYLGEIFAGIGNGDSSARRHTQQIQHLNSLEADRAAEMRN